MNNTARTLSVLWSEILIKTVDAEDFLSLTDIAKYKNMLEPDQVIRNRLRNKYTIEFLWIWEKLYNSNFNPIEFDGVRNEAGANAFTLSPSQWIEKVNAIGIVSKAWRYWGTFAHKDIALEFASRISVEVKLYLIKDYQRLKEEEMKTREWSVKRLIAKTNYKIHTDAIKENLIPAELTTQQKSFVYADEADILNVALFWQTARQRKERNLDKKGNMRDEATIEQLIVLSNMESINAELIRQDLPQSQRLEILNTSAIHQMQSLLGTTMLHQLRDL